MNTWVGIGLLIFFILFGIIGFALGFSNEKKSFNNGKCINCGTKLRLMGENKIPDSKVVRLDPEKERLIVTFNCIVNSDVRNKVQQQMLEEYKTGVVVLPPLFSACIVKAETDIELRFHEENSVVVNLKNNDVEENEDEQ